MGVLEAVFLRGIALKHRTPSAEKKASPFIIGSLPCKGEIICRDVVSIRYHITSASVIVN
jgi:hypothetical protein